MSGKQQRTANLARAANAMQNGQARSLDALTEYEEFREMFAPAIRQALVKGKSAEAIMAEFKPLVAARLVQLGLLGSETAALGAIREMLDRQDGKPVAKTETVHKFQKLGDAELDAMVQTKLEQLKTIEATAESVEILEDDA